MVAPLRSRSAELGFWSPLQRQHSVLWQFCANKLTLMKTPSNGNRNYSLSTQIAVHQSSGMSQSPYVSQTTQRMKQTGVNTVVV